MTPNCPQCQGDAYELGTLGKYTHFKCRNCGTEFRTVIKSPKQKSIERRQAYRAKEKRLRADE